MHILDHMPRDLRLRGRRHYFDRGWVPEAKEQVNQVTCDETQRTLYVCVLYRYFGLVVTTAQLPIRSGHARKQMNSCVSAEGYFQI